mmetsp:Transcript_17830/g.56201  ORF Transcript_17830/g.56201 Transcript_17830/m.56201 type:complete len:145 (-) Transcript_17830:274-708(-)|eukprot:CAMPEP_0204610984 /NCGR_PEP_ID=MMETSP0661-20131031/61787_1 /ASSEMBLY_ACC=CAM_ASM_000606 /TAXON_ID=109239 /ORGANISM="Alexandrium margalefi, Strain AMGDE01CS-322" /LENGTH=144 /DNA_ID=CAMNT_0051622813 /DNA_START=90 /DNA_END=524 /DNA_ORIENTATION=+
MHALASTVALLWAALLPRVGGADWYVGCAQDDLENRGQVAVDLDVAKLKRHVRLCLDDCTPPSEGCTLDTVPLGCDCLKCMMYCLKHGSYAFECLNKEQEQLCNATRQRMGGHKACDVDCSHAQGLVGAPLGLMAVAAALLAVH